MRLLSGTWFPFSTILAMALAGCGPQGNPEPELTVKKTCPDHDVVARFNDAHARVPPVLASLGDSVDIPEFHDCQRLLEPDSANQGVKYGPHVAVFRLDGFHLGGAVAAAVVWNLDYPKTYGPLGITTEFACLFVDQAAEGPHARMVPVTSDQDCPTLGPTSSGVPLWVKRDAPPGYHADDYPNAARWDIDPGRLWQNIGITCGQGWCEVGHDDQMQTSGLLTVTSPRIQGRVSRIKGWFDQQLLAEPGVPGNPTLHPGGALGTIYPDGSLDHFATAAFPQNDWTPVAVITLSQASPTYANKLNLTLGENAVALCHGAVTACPGASAALSSCGATANPAWWARIISGVGAVPRFYCVERHPHDTFRIPGTARWQWLDNDDLIWTQCGTACCKIKA